MSTSSVQILSRQDRKPVEAILHSELRPSVLVEIEKEWGPLRMAAARKHYRAGRVSQIPEHYLWDWGAKSKKLKFLAYQCLGIECAGKWQGLLMVQLAGKFARLEPDKGKELVYIDYLEAAPWNLAMIVETPEYGGIGSILMRTALQLSYDEGFLGRIGLHALSQSEEFYRDACEMTFCGHDASYQDLPYYEMNRDLAAKFTSSSIGGTA